MWANGELNAYQAVVQLCGAVLAIVAAVIVVAAAASCVRLSIGTEQHVRPEQC